MLFEKEQKLISKAYEKWVAKQNNKAREEQLRIKEEYDKLGHNHQV
jgi:hypothetical protein